MTSIYYLLLTVCLPISGECKELVVAEYSAVTECLMDATALRATTQDDETFYITCMGVETK